MAEKVRTVRSLDVKTRNAKPKQPKRCLNCGEWFTPLRVTARFCADCKALHEDERTRRHVRVENLRLCCFRYSNGARCDMPSERVAETHMFGGLAEGRGFFRFVERAAFCTFHAEATNRGKAGARHKRSFEYKAVISAAHTSPAEIARDAPPPLTRDAFFEAQTPERPELYLGRNRGKKDKDTYFTVDGYGVIHPDDCEYDSDREAGEGELARTGRAVQEHRDRRGDDPTFEAVWQKMCAEALARTPPYSPGRTVGVEASKTIKVEADTALRYVPGPPSRSDTGPWSGRRLSFVLDSAQP